jgi:hypothetical protein
MAPRIVGIVHIAALGRDYRVGKLFDRDHEILPV